MTVERKNSFTQAASGKLGIPPGQNCVEALRGPENGSPIKEPEASELGFGACQCAEPSTILYLMSHIVLPIPRDVRCRTTPKKIRIGRSTHGQKSQKH